jgi:hypothetical protein
MGPEDVHRRADNSLPVSFTVSAWEWVYATNLSRLQRETSKRYVGEAHRVLITAILLPQRLSSYWGKIMSLRMLTNLRLAYLRVWALRNREPLAKIFRPTYTPPPPAPELKTWLKDWKAIGTWQFPVPASQLPFLSLCTEHHVKQICLAFEPEDWRRKSLRNVCQILPEYTASCPRTVLSYFF